MVDGRVAVACRLCVDELEGHDGLERAEIGGCWASSARCPDLWDFMSGTGISIRFRRASVRRGARSPTCAAAQGADDEAGGWRRAIHLGRHDGQEVRQGVLDLIGAARPSIADPFLPNKIKAGRGRTSVSASGAISA